MYAYFDSVPACYGNAKIDFLELGLSADSSYGAAIPDLYDIPFLTNSDAHSPYPDKLGREFNRIRLGEKTAKGVLAAIKAGAVEMNAGFFPEEGKYNRTACTRCYEQYSLEDAIRHQWRCPADGGIIKKGVSDRAKELSAWQRGPAPPTVPPRHPACPDHPDHGRDIVTEHEEVQGDLCLVHRDVRQRDCGAH